MSILLLYGHAKQSSCCYVLYLIVNVVPGFFSSNEPAVSHAVNDDATGASEGESHAWETFRYALERTFRAAYRLFNTAVAARDPVLRPSASLMYTPASISLSRSMPVSMSMPCSMYTTSSVAALPVAPLA